MGRNDSTLGVQMSSDSYTGIYDSEASIIQSMSSSAFAPMVLPVLFILLPVIASVATGLSLNVLYPKLQPGEYGWANLAILYPLEAWYVVKKWKEAAKGN